MVSEKEVPEGCMLIYSTEQLKETGGKNDGFNNIDGEYNWMDADWSQAQITPMSEISEGYAPIRNIDDL